MFVGMHAVLAMRIDAPEFVITEDEGKEFMKAAQNVMRHYSVKTTQKTMDMVALIGICVTIYAPRFAAVTMRRRAEQSEGSHGGNVVVDFPYNGRPA